MTRLMCAMSFTMPEFDLHELQSSVNATRRARNLTWAAAPREVGVAASTLRGLDQRREVEGDGVLQILRWLGRTPESFVPGSPLAGSHGLASRQRDSFVLYRGENEMIRTAACQR